MFIRGFAMNSVEITEPVLQRAFQAEQQYLHSLEPDRLLAGFRETAGLEKKADRYAGGWENAEISGHTLGHYMVAMAQIYASTLSEEARERLNYILQELSACQAENGYLFTSPEEIFNRLESGYLVWVPWYTMHKVIAGLLAVYQLAEMPKALEIAEKLGMWVHNRVTNWTDKMRKNALCVDYGGMADCLYELSLLTKKEEYAQAAEKFDDPDLMHQIAAGNDVLCNKRANATIPKFLGAINRYLLLGESEQEYLDAAKSFFDIVIKGHTYVTGGNSEGEHFRVAGKLGKNRTSCTCKSCNTYNMLKLAERLYQVTGDKKYMDYYERTYYNAVLGSQDPESGMTTYFQPMATGFFKSYSTPYGSFWCCTGTGMESFTKLNSGIYHVDGDNLYVNRYVSSVLDSKEIGLRLTQSVDIESFDSLVLTLDLNAPKEFALCIRIPDWSEERVEVQINGDVPSYRNENGYLVLDRTWTDGDRVFVSLTPQIMIHRLKDMPSGMALTYGPMALAASLGREEMVTERTSLKVTVPTKNVSVREFIVITESTFEEWFEDYRNKFIKKTDEMAFTIVGTDADKELLFTPYYKHYDNRYGIYFDYYGEEELPSDLRREWERKKKEAEANAAEEAARYAALAAAEAAAEAERMAAEEEERRRAEQERLAAEEEARRLAEEEAARIAAEEEAARLAAEEEARRLAEEEAARLAAEEEARIAAEEEARRLAEEEAARLAAEEEARRLAEEEAARIAAEEEAARLAAEEEARRLAEEEAARIAAEEEARRLAEEEAARIAAEEEARRLAEEEAARIAAEEEARRLAEEEATRIAAEEEARRLAEEEEARRREEQRREEEAARAAAFAAQMAAIEAAEKAEKEEKVETFEETGWFEEPYEEPSEEEDVVFEAVKEELFEEEENDHKPEEIKLFEEEPEDEAKEPEEEVKENLIIAEAARAAELAEAKAREEEAILQAARLEAERAEAEATIQRARAEAAEAERQAEAAKVAKAEETAKLEKANKAASKAAQKNSRKNKKRRARKSAARSISKTVGWIVGIVAVIVALYVFAVPLTKGFFVAKDAVDTFLADKFPKIAEKIGVEGNGQGIPQFSEAKNVTYCVDGEFFVRNSNLPSGYKASVVEKDMKEYILIEGNGLKMYYLNGIAENDSKQVIMESGNQKAVRFWDYNFSQPLLLCPDSGNYNAEGTKQYVFWKNVEKTEFIILDGTTLEEYKVVPYGTELKEMLDSASFTEIDQRVRIDMAADGIKYAFSVMKPSGSIYAAEDYELALEGLSYTLLQNEGIRFDAYVVSNGNYLGKVVGKLDCQNQVYTLGRFDFYAYADEEYGDMAEDPVIKGTTLIEAKKDRVLVNGHYGERVLIPVNEEVKKNSYSDVSFVKGGDGTYTYVQMGKTISAKGVDVSADSGVIDWEKVAASGVEYAMIRLGYRDTSRNGSCKLDAKFKKNVEGALDAGLKVGVYFTSQATTEKEAEEEAKYVLRNIGDYEITWPVAFDTQESVVEDARANGISREARTACAKTFMDAIAAEGYKAALYTNTRWSVFKLDMSQLKDYAFWYAYYGDVPTYPYHYDMWQYTNAGTVDGIEGNATLSISLVNYGSAE